jgi:hypothetical protein
MNSTIQNRAAGQFGTIFSTKHFIYLVWVLMLLSYGLRFMASHERITLERQIADYDRRTATIKEANGYLQNELDRIQSLETLRTIAAEMGFQTSRPDQIIYLYDVYR